MTQSAVEWLEQELKTKYGLFTSLYPEFEQAKQIEAEQSKIPELSDEEIEKAANAYSAVNSINELALKDKYNDFIYAAKWYREQLKQRQ